MGLKTERPPCLTSTNRRALIATRMDLNLILTERPRMKKKMKKQKTKIPRTRQMRTIVVDQLENGDARTEQMMEIGLGGRRNEKKSILIE